MELEHPRRPGKVAARAERGTWPKLRPASRSVDLVRLVLRRAFLTGHLSAICCGGVVEDPGDDGEELLASWVGLLFLLS